MNYNEYLQSAYWKERRYAALERAEFKCELCGEIDSLDVHHKTYDRLGNEDPGDLIVMCKGHHWIEHIPKIDINPLPIKTDKKCAYAIGLARKLEKLLDLYASVGTIDWDTREEIRADIDRVERMLDKHYRKCSICPHPPRMRLSKKERKVLRMERNKRLHEAT
jgi:hypothetical protein